jgi:hypothetical protein
VVDMGDDREIADLADVGHAFFSWRVGAPLAGDRAKREGGIRVPTGARLT